MIGVYVNVFNRPRLAVRSLESLRRGINNPFRITIIDDGSNEEMTAVRIIGDQYIRLPENLGPGRARKAAFDMFLRSTHVFGVFLDSDLEYRGDFGHECLRLLEHACRQPNRWVSPYRSRNHLAGDVSQFDHVLGATAGGATLVGSRETVANAVKRVPDWGKCYDWNLCKVSNGFVKPVRSLVQHIGVRTEGSVHPDSDDEAVDYD